MTFPDPSTPSAPLNSGDASCKELRGLVHSVAIAMLILTGTVFVFLYRQVVLVRRQTAEMTQFLAEYEHSNTRELIRQMQNRFDEFRRQNADFTPIFIKYFGSNEPAATPPKASPAATNPPVKR
jgi:hypothetical protein